MKSPICKAPGGKHSAGKTTKWLAYYLYVYGNSFLLLFRNPLFACGSIRVKFNIFNLTNLTSSSHQQNAQIHDSSLGGSSDDDDFLGVLRGPSSFANAFLYVGLGTVAIGLVIAFVGTGEKGFKTVELRLIGPSLIGNIFFYFYCSCSHILRSCLRHIHIY